MVAKLKTREVAHEIGVTPATIRNWRDDGCPCEPFGAGYLYDLDAVRQWAAANGKTGLSMAQRMAAKAEKSEALAASAGGDYDDWKTRNEAAKAQINEEKLQQIRMSLLEVDAVKAAWRKYILDVKAKLAGLGSRMAASLVGLDERHIAERIDEEVGRALRDLAKWTPKDAKGTVETVDDE